MLRGKCKIDIYFFLLSCNVIFISNVCVQSGSWYYDQFKQLREQIRNIKLIKGALDLKFSYPGKEI